MRRNCLVILRRVVLGVRGFLVADNLALRQGILVVRDV